MDYCSETRLNTSELQMSSSDTESATNIKLSDSEVFSGMRAGNKQVLEKMRSSETPMSCFKNEKGDTILHVTASFGHLELVESIVSQCPSLLLEKNCKHRIPLHVAARSGHSEVVKVLAASMECPYVVKDINGDTPLHLALKDLKKKTKAEFIIKYELFRRQVFVSLVNNYSPFSMTPKKKFEASTHIMETSMFLVRANRCVSFLANNDEISPLYLAIKVGNLSLVNAMLGRADSSVQGISSNLASPLQGRKSLVHAALYSKNTHVLDVILNEYPDLVNERDEQGQTCLSVGASIGFYQGICKLLDRSTSGIFECDKDGSFPVHKATEEDNEHIVEEFLKRCPDSIEQLNKQGQNILHIAANAGNGLVPYLMRYIRKVGTKNHLIEEQDVEGNTPLHLATIKWRPRTIRCLVSFKPIITTIPSSTIIKVLYIQNKDGLRPLDIAQINLNHDYILRERMTLMVLLCVYKPLGVSWIPTSGMTLGERSNQVVGDEKFRDRINVLLVMATLVATITFAAGFTMPGGFNSSPPKVGMAILEDDKTLTSFLVCDTLAMQFSLVAIVALVWAQLGDQDLAHKAFHLALPSLLFALCCMSLAFLYGVQATIKENKSLAKTTIIISGILTSLMMLLLTPYVIPQLHDIPLLRELSYFYLEFLLFFSSRDKRELYLHEMFRIG